MSFHEQAKTLKKEVAELSARYVEQLLQIGSETHLRFTTQFGNVLQLSTQEQHLVIETPNGRYQHDLDSINDDWLFRKTAAALSSNFQLEFDNDEQDDYNITVVWNITHADHPASSIGSSIGVDHTRLLLELWLTDAKYQKSPYSILSAPPINPQDFHGSSKDVQVIIMNHVQHAAHTCSMSHCFTLHGRNVPTLTIGKLHNGNYGIAKNGELCWTVSDGEMMAAWLIDIMVHSYSMLVTDINIASHNIELRQWPIAPQQWPSSQDELNELSTNGDRLLAGAAPNNKNAKSDSVQQVEKALEMAINTWPHPTRFRLSIEARHQTVEIVRRADNTLSVVGETIMEGDIATVSKQLASHGILNPETTRNQITIECCKTVLNVLLGFQQDLTMF